MRRLTGDAAKHYKRRADAAQNVKRVEVAKQATGKERPGGVKRTRNLAGNAQNSQREIEPNTRARQKSSGNSQAATRRTLDRQQSVAGNRARAANPNSGAVASRPIAASTLSKVTFKGSTPTGRGMSVGLVMDLTLLQPTSK